MRRTQLRKVTDDLLAEYYLLGWCVKRDHDPVQVPVQIHHGWRAGLFLLDDDGDYRVAYPDTGLDEAV